MEMFYEAFFFLVCVVMLFVHMFCICILRTRCGTNQDDDVWNISSRVNQQNQDSATNWPTHDHRISVHDFVLTPEYNTKDTRPPPPPYSEVDLPSYEQATGCRPPRPDITPVHQTSENRPGPSS